MNGRLPLVLFSLISILKLCVLFFISKMPYSLPLCQLSTGGSAHCTTPVLFSTKKYFAQSSLCLYPVSNLFAARGSRGVFFFFSDKCMTSLLKTTKVRRRPFLY